GYPQGYPQQGAPAGYPQGYTQQGAPEAAPAPAAAPAEDPVAKLAQFKAMLDQGLISQEEFDAAKAKALGL
ncbi:MAG: SHOCT domain-containing protein, partial [Buchananella hordeovulneris]|nr:SHOCT domain-containing protein [Buchananella hordeovulneris]